MLALREFFWDWIAPPSLESWIESGLYQLLLQDSTVNAIVKGSIHFNRMLKEASLPAIVLQGIAGGPIVTLDSTLSLNERRFQFDSYASDYLSTRKLSKRIRQLLQDFSGPLYDGTIVQGVVVNLDIDMPWELGGTGYVYRALLDFSIFYQELPS